MKGLDSAPDLQPVKKTALYEVVAERLREFIDLQHLGSGDRLPPEREIAARLGVSRTSVRQALTSLSAVGLIQMRHGEGAFLMRSLDDVIPTLAQELLNQYAQLPAIMEVREALETQTCRLAARRHGPTDIEAMEKALQEMQRAVDAGDDPSTGDALFHRAITHAAHNDLLSDLMDQLSEAIDATRRASLSRPGRPPQSLAAHRMILEAIASRDPGSAAECMRAHLAVVADVAYATAD
ncbi:MAG TPA: FadR/GntR family transcriptional regulator [Solirubrobacteraceae bacterium]|jgi:GntR family transcriptional repressor for pyruvate dehydrogenase complex